MTRDVSEVNDLFLTLIEDYRINLLYQTSGSSVLNTYLEGWLLYSINDFENICTQSLAYDTNTQQFAEILTRENILILAQIMSKYWLTKLVQDVLQMQNSIQDHDYKTFSQAQNLKEKRDYLNNKKEEISQILQDYAYKYNGWSEWNIQVFSGS
jgi:hypothetical protein